MNDRLRNIVSFFDIEGTLADISQLGDGFINDTYIVKTAGGSPNYILQRKNNVIFTDVPAMMDNIVRVCNHIKNTVAAKGGDPLREAMTVVFTHDGSPYYRDSQGEFWTMTLFIEDTLSYNSASSSKIAYQGGKGIGMFQRTMADFNAPLADILPGFHNLRFRFAQWDEAVSGDAAGRVASLGEEIGWVESRRGEMMDFWSRVESGEIPVRVTHNDTKINNILFDNNENVLCVIDLDTVLNGIVLNDFGDAIRTYANTGAEDDKNLDRVSMSLEMFRAFAEGYLSQAKSFLNAAEKQWLPFAARFIVFEQVLRFLMDYINGDTYYKIKHPHHNLTRTKAQYKLLCSIEAQYPEMQRIVNELCDC